MLLDNAVEDSGWKTRNELSPMLCKYVTWKLWLQKVSRECRGELGDPLNTPPSPWAYLGCDCAWRSFDRRTNAVTRRPLPFPP